MPKIEDDATTGKINDIRCEGTVVEIKSLVPDPNNARLHPNRNMDAIRRSLALYGQQSPLVVRKQNRVVAAGNGRMKAMLELGWTKCAVTLQSMTDAEFTGFALADNRTAELAKWDLEVVARLEALQREAGDDEGMVGWSDNELYNLRSHALADSDEPPKPPDDPITRPGDLWVLGPHRLLCGDSSKPEDVDVLLDGAPIHLVNTDPPYNVKVEPRSKNAIAAGMSSFGDAKRTKATSVSRAKDRPLANDFVSDGEFDDMLAAWFGNIARVLEPGRGFYIWGGYSNCANYPPVLTAMGLYFSQAIIWVKEHPVLTRKDFMGNHEWCFYGWREGAAHKYFGPHNATDVWSVKKVNQSAMVHLTEKPVELAARAMEYSSKKGENVLDLFGGSGSTLIAAHQTGRRAYLMELDAPYCDVIVQRWANVTGLDPVRGDGKKWSELTKKPRRG